jgi:hypothetical protein
MRSGESVDQHARKNDESAKKATEKRMAETVRPKLGPYAGSEKEKKNIGKANQRALELLKKEYANPDTVVENKHVLEVLQLIGNRDCWPTQKRDNVSPDGKDVPGQ